MEVNNTDAEGRLTLADAMWFAQVGARAGGGEGEGEVGESPILADAKCTGKLFSQAERACAFACACPNTYAQDLLVASLSIHTRITH